MDNTVEPWFPPAPSPSDTDALASSREADRVFDALCQRGAFMIAVEAEDSWARTYRACRLAVNATDPVPPQQGTGPTPLAALCNLAMKIARKTDH